MKPFPIILSAPSGGGKTAITHSLLAARQDVGYSISCTTRAPREGEVHGRDYHFLSAAEFIARRERGEFAESADVHGQMYGTLRAEVRRVLESGRHVIMDIDVQGAAQFHAAFPDSVLIFILPPTGEVLLERLKARNTENRASLVRRMKSALVELRAVERYQYVVVNDELERAVSSVSGVIDAEMRRRERLEHVEHDVREIVARLEQELVRHDGPDTSHSTAG